jgi:hypothetical protein
MKRVLVFISIFIFFSISVWAAPPLRQNTATVVIVGPFTDQTDGYTPETALTSVDIEAVLFRQLSDTYFSSSYLTITGIAAGDNQIDHRNMGFYQFELSADDTAYYGRLGLAFTGTAFLPVFYDYKVLNQNAYDTLFATTGTDYLKVDTVQIEGTDATDSIVSNSDLGATSATVERFDRIRP